MMEQQVQERAADATATIALGSWTMSLTTVNAVLETVTLTLGLVAAGFSVYFHVRRALRERKTDGKLDKLLKNIEAKPRDKNK